MKIKIICAECLGMGKMSDADCGDIFYNLWDCPTCKGDGYTLQKYNGEVMAYKFTVKEKKHESR